MAPVPGDSSKHQFGTSIPQGGHPPHHSITSSATAFIRALGSAFWRKNDAEQHPFVRACLHGSADMSATIGRDHIVDLAIGNRRPFAVYLDLVMVADHA